MTSLLQAVSSYIQRLLPACWGFPQAPRTAHKWSGYAFGSRTLNGCARTGIVYFDYILSQQKQCSKYFLGRGFCRCPKQHSSFLLHIVQANYRRMCRHKQEIIACPCDIRQINRYKNLTASRANLCACFTCPGKCISNMQVQVCTVCQPCHLRNKGISKPLSAAAYHRIRNTTAASRADCPSPRLPPFWSGSR